MNEKNVKHSRKFLHEFFGKELTVANFINVIEKAKDEELVEIMCHPAYVDKYLMENSGYNIQRAYEVEVLTSDKLKKYIRENSIELIGFKELEKI